jgi:hypothetical protein
VTLSLEVRVSAVESNSARRRQTKCLPVQKRKYAFPRSKNVSKGYPSQVKSKLDGRRK